MNFYEQREWSLYTVFSTAAGILLALLIICAEKGGSALAQTLPWFLPMLLGIGLFILAINGSIHIALNATELKVSIGHLAFMRRTLPLDTILRIERTRVAWYQAKPKKGWGVKTERYAVAPGEAFTVYSATGKPCVIQSKNTEAILSLLKRHRSRIEFV